ncbi:MAG: hypothetical protein ABI442_05585 [Gemmatimonadaceae bacterium]
MSVSSVGEPRVLVLSAGSFNRVHGTGITLSNLFQGWPRERLAMIYADPVKPSAETCDAFYLLSDKEISRLGPLLGMRPIQHDAPPPPQSSGRSLGAAVGTVAKAALFGNMLPDNGRLSGELESWIDDFRPTVVYTPLGSNAMMDLALAIRARFETRLVVHFMDDWPSHAYRDGIASAVGRRRMEKLVRDTIDAADLCLGISPAMCDAFAERYGKPFQPFMNAIDLESYADVARPTRNPNEILYVGTISPLAQLQSLVDACHAAASLRDRGVTLTILSMRGFIDQHRDVLEIAPNITVAEASADTAEFIRRIQSAAVLMLPVNYDAKSLDFIRYSMPTKVPAYMASETPILAYGPGSVAQIDYAQRDGWAHVVSERSNARLGEAMERLIADDSLRHDITERAVAVVRANHDINVVAARFQSALSSLGG